MTEDVLLTAQPWFPGLRTVGWYAPLNVSITVSGMSWEEGIDQALEAARERARALGANAVFNLAITCDPYHKDGGKIDVEGSIGSCVPYVGASVTP